MHSDYKPNTSITQILVALVATVVIGSAAIVGTVGPATAAPIQIVATA